MLFDRDLGKFESKLIAIIITVMIIVCICSLKRAYDMDIICLINLLLLLLHHTISYLIYKVRFQLCP
jgi:hypothetical protein